MVVPLLLAGMLAGLAVSGGANLYAQYQQRQVYQHEEEANKALMQGYNKYLSRQGLSANPNRAWNSYYGAAYRAAKNTAASYAGSVGTLGGTVGAGFGYSRGLFDAGELGKMYRRL